MMDRDDLEKAARWHAHLGETPDGASADAANAAFAAWSRTSPARESAFISVAVIDSIVRDLAAEPALRSLGEEALERARAVRPSNRRWAIAGVLSGLCILPVAAMTIHRLVVAPSHPIAQLPPLQEFATSAGQRRLVKLNNGSRVLLDTASRLRVRGSTLEVQGQAAITVGAGPVHLRLHQALVTIRSGTLNVRTASKRVDMLAQSTNAAASLNPGPAADPVLATTGKTMTWSDGKARIAEASDPEAVVSWQTGWLQFEDVALNRAVEEVNRYRRKPIRLVGNTPALRISGSFRTGDTGAFLDAVEASLPVTVNRAADPPVIIAGPSRK